MADYLEKLDYRISELSSNNNVFAEGGEFYYCPNDKLLFSGANRTSIKGADEVASFLNVNELIIIESQAFHLDTVFTTVLDSTGNLCAVIVCKELISKKSNCGIEYIDNPRNEAKENELEVDNKTFIDLGFKPRKLEDNLINEIESNVTKYLDRIDKSKILSKVKWN